ncbi:MAG: hypothetical protein ACPG7F_00785 [Aggregatilineales bacterium]
MTTSDTQWQNRIVEHGQIKASAVQFHPQNPRIHPDAQRRATAGSLDSLGQLKSIIINQRNGLLVDGHDRVSLALTQNPDMLLNVEYVDISDDEHKQALLVLDYIVTMADYDRDNAESLMQAINSDDARMQALFAGIGDELQLNIPEDFPEYDEGIADSVEMCTCPNCGHEFPK